MRLKCLKSVLAVLIIAGIAGCLVSCPDDVFNPFSTSLGAKVPIERPTITVTSPDTGSYLKGEVTITGKVGAYRQLNDVKIKVKDKILTFESLKETMTFGAGTLEGESKNDKTFSYTFDTTELNDGPLQVQFQVIDPDFTVDSVTYQYIIKNKPSTIDMTNPNSEHLYLINDTGDITGLNLTPTGSGEIITGSKLLGNIVDLRGLKPGYPRIKIWEENEAEPADWAVLFVSGVDDTDTFLETGYGAREDLTNAQVKNNVTFVFSLSKFTLINDPRDNTRKIIKYDRDNGGGLVPLDQGIYRFRILTSDTFFVEKKGDPQFLYPREPQWKCPTCNALYAASGPCPQDGAATIKEQEITVCEPDGNKWGADSYHTINVRPTTAITTKIILDNGDVDRNDLINQPNIYMEKDLAEKITVAPAERPTGYDPDDPVKRITDFRLRINAYHPDGVENAILKWSHATLGSGFLTWDDIGTAGYVNDAAKAAEGHKGMDNPLGVGKIFQFTGYNGKTYTYQNLSGVTVTGEVFTSSTTAYKLTVDTYLTTGQSDEPVSQDYFLLLDDSGPDVTISDIKGKSKGPAGDPDPKAKGGTINKNEYTVNDNIEVSQYSSAANAIRVKDGKPVIKWFVELADANDTDGNTHLTKSNILLQRLQEFRSKPTQSQDFITYFESDSTLGTTAVARGVVDQNIFKLSVDTRTTVDSNGAKTPVNGNTWNNRYLWLYVVAQDGLYNLGYTVQKLKVDDNGDKPVLELLGGIVDSSVIANPNNLYAVEVNGQPVKSTTNILGRGQGIELSLSDDDGMRAAAFTGDRTIAITLTSLNFPGVTVEVDASELFGTGAFKEWNDSLGQALLARALVARLKALGRQTVVDKLYPGTTTYTTLPDGVYTLVIDVPDALSQKIDVPNYPKGQARTTKTIHFAVQSDLPRIEIDDIGSSEGTNYLTGGARDITGKVTSRLKIRRLDISFTPDIVSNPTSADPSPVATLPLYANAYTSPAGWTWSSAEPDANGEYTYYWRRTGVDFGVSVPTTSTERRFDMQAWDSVGVPAVEKRTVQVDYTAPVVALYSFNFGRTDAVGVTTPPDPDANWNRVNGKIALEVEVTDANGVGTQDNNTNPAIRWFILPSTSTVVPQWNTVIANESAVNGRSGYFISDDQRGQGSTRYRTIIDTTNGTGGLNLTADGKYKVYVIARDKAGNVSNDNDSGTPAPAAPMLTEFKVVQSTDNPRLQGDLVPKNGDVVGGAGAVLKITGSIFDDDGFDPNKANSYVEILFPATYNASTGEPTTWGSGWLAVAGEVNSVTGYLDFTYDFSTNRPAYLSFDSVKRYRLRVKDEVLRGNVPDTLGAYKPEGKNPDMYKGDGTNRAAAPANNLAAVTITLPGTTTNYSFELKNSNPEIFFSNYDPNDCHRIGHAFNSEHDHSGNTPVDVNKPGFFDVAPENVRPTFGGTNLTTARDALLAALNGTGSTVVDTRLGEAEFSFAGITQKFTLTPAPADGKTYPWSIASASLGSATASPATGFFGAAQGTHSIIIFAADTLGNSSTVEWSFNKDTEGPDINFDNIHRTNVRTISGEPGSVNITGEFSDLYAEIGATYDYRFDSETAWTTVTLASTAFTSHGAAWSVPIPTTRNNVPFVDGRHTFSIRARDALGNQNEALNITFVVDRQAPQIPTKPEGTGAANRMIVKGSGLAGVSPNGTYLTENERVFSAGTVLAPGYSTETAMTPTPPATWPTKVGDRVVFTLSGLVYEHNLNSLRFNFRNGTTAVLQTPITLTGVDASAVAWNKTTAPPANTWFYGRKPDNSADLGQTENSLRIKRAAGGEFGFASNASADTLRNYYVWELDVRERDFHSLVTAGTGMEDDGITRSITVIARDLANFDSEMEVWPFFLDTSPPKIEFSNITYSASTYTPTILEDQGDITLKGTAVDSTKIRLLQYKIEKKNDYALADTNDSAWTVTTVSAPDNFKNYTGAGVGTESRVSWNITDAAAIPSDGKYRVTIRAYDYSLQASAGGNETIVGPVLFWVDRAEPEIKWGASFTTTANGTDNTNPIGGNIATRYFTYANHGLLVGDSVTVNGTPRYVVYVNGNNFKLSDTNVWPNTTVWNPGAGNITLTAWGTETKTYYRWVNNAITFDLSVRDANTFDSAASWEVRPYGGTAVVRSANTNILASPNTTSSKVTVAIPSAGTTMADGRYTLELTIKDKTNKKASFNQTLNFYLDTTKPAIDLKPTTRTEAITGRVEFDGVVTEANLITRVAFKVSQANLTDGSVTALDDASLKGDGWFFNDSSSTAPYKMWVKTDGASGVGTISNTAPPSGEAAQWSALIDINMGTKNPTLLLYDTRRVINAKNVAAAGSDGANLLGTSAKAIAGITFNTITVRDNTKYPDDLVSPLRIHLLAIDEAGNHKVESFNYYVFPAGDTPQLTAITNPNAAELEVTRQLNGTIKIQGTAEDNYRIRNVWFRVLKDGAAVRTFNTTAFGSSNDVATGTTYFTYTNHGLAVGDKVTVGTAPTTTDHYVVWVGNIGAATGNNSFKLSPAGTWTNSTAWTMPTPANITITTSGYEPATNLAVEDQTSSTALTGYGAGWYKAATGGINKTLTWYAQINTNGELEPTTGSSRRIIIQAVAEDTIWDDSLNNNNGGYAETGNMLSPLKEVSAFVVSGAPTFSGEQVRSAASGSTDVNNPWGNILTSAVRGRSAYQVTVRHTSGLGAIRWTNAPSGASVSSTQDILTGATFGGVDTEGSPGIAVKAEPKNPITGTAAIPAGTYMIWNAFSTVPASGVPISSAENVRHTTFTTSGATNNGATLLRRQDDGNYEWLITVDLDLNTLLGENSPQAGHYEANFEAHDNSKSVALFSRKNAQIPYDRAPPKGVYTQNTNVVGSNAQFGGEAEDDTDVAVHGLSRVVLWFSRNVSGVGERAIIWDKLAYVASDFQGMATNTSNFTAAFGDIVDINKLTTGTYSSVYAPNMTHAATAVSGNHSYIVIDRQDPLANTAHHGHQLAMGWAASNGAMDQSWYVVLNSELIESGRVTAHYIVYDKAGNGRYYNQRLMVLNGVAKINTITLATDIYGEYSPLKLQAGLDANPTDPGTNNLKFGAATNLVTANTGTRSGSAIDTIRTLYKNTTAMGITDDDPDSVKGISEAIPIDTTRPNVYSVIFDQKDFAVRNKLLAIKVDTTVAISSTEKDRHYRVEYVSGAVVKSGTDPAVAGNPNANPVVNPSLTHPTNGIRAGRVYIINAPGTNFPWGVLGAQGETFQRGMVFLALQDGYDLDLSAGGYGTPSVWELNGAYYSNAAGAGPALTRTVAGTLPFTDSSDVTYTKLGNGQTASSGIGKTAEFVYRAAAFGTTAGSAIRDFNAGTNGANLDSITGRPKPYSDLAAATTAPWSDVSLFIIKIFDGPEEELFGDFALLSIRVNNNDLTPPYSQLYDLNPKTETEALSPGEGIGGNRTKGGLWNTTENKDNVEKSGHIEPRAGTSLTNANMGGGSGSITRPAAQPTVGTTRAYFTVDTVSGDVIVRGYAEDNQRIARVDLEIWSTAATPARVGSPVTILTRDKSTTGSTAKNLLKPATYTDTTVDPAETKTRVVQFNETVELDRHRVEWAYVWNTETLPGGNNVVGNFSIRAVAYNANTTVTGTDPDPNEPDPVNTSITRNENVHTSKLITRSTLTNTNRTNYDTFNVPEFPASTGNFYRYNQILVNIRPYITGFLRSRPAHDIRSRQGRYIFAREESPVVTGFNLRNGNGTHNIILPGGAGTASTTRVTAAIAAPDDTQAANYGIPTPVRATRYQRFTVPATTAYSGNGLITMVVNNYSAVNTPTPVATAANETDANLRPTVGGLPVVQPWNKEYSAGVEGSELWDDYTMVHIWQSNAAMGDNDRGRFAKGAFNITYPSMSIDPVTGRLWASHQEGGRKPTQTGGSLYPGGGAYISNNSSTYPYENTDTAAFTGTGDGLRQIAAFSEHMTDTNVFVDGSSRVWAVTNSITKYNAANRWRFLPGMWLWGPVSTYDNQNGSPMISHFPRTTSTVDTTYHWFPFPNTGNGLTGMYAVESLWYNGATNSRTIASPQSTDQFFNPHVVAYLGGTNNNHVHVSYYDKKDGSLKYRYNVVGTTGVVNSEASQRRWVNLDGGADIDDNSSYNETQGKGAAGAESASYIGNYTAETAVNPNSGLDAPQDNAATSPYAGGTVYTRATATKRGAALTDSNSYIHKVLVQNGAYVTSGQDIYAVGGVAQSSADDAHITAAAAGFIVLNFRAPVASSTAGNWSTTGRPGADDPVYRIYPVNTTNSRIVSRDLASPVNAGSHNSIAVTSQGYPVVAYYDETNRALKLAVSNNAAPTLASNWKIFDSGDVIPNSSYRTGTGEYVSIQIDTRATLPGTTTTNPELNYFHIAAMNAINKNVVYIKGKLNIPATPGATDWAANYTLSNITVQVVDNVGNVGNWCKLSLDKDGNPWIAYMDDGYKGSRDGAKIAYKNTAAFYKGSIANHYPGDDIDAYGTSITGWEAMHVPTQFRVEDAQLGMERFPTVRAPTATRSAGFANFAAVGFLGEDYYRIAYYVE